MTLYATSVVPNSITVGDQSVLVGRAWPAFDRGDDGRLALTVEGPDTRGALRAARAQLSQDVAGSWSVDDVELAPAGEDPKLPELAGAMSGGASLVVHRFGKRAVVAAESSYIKLVRPKVTETTVNRAEQGRTLASVGGFAAPDVLDATPGRVDFSVLAGTALHDLGRSTDLATWEQIWTQWAWSWSTMVRAEGDGLPRHEASDEQDILLRWWSAVSELNLLPPFVAGQFADRLDRVNDELSAEAGSRRVVSHRDLHDKQILFDPAESQLGLLDFDTAALAEPELDLANLLVHIELRRDQRWWSREHAAIATTYVYEAAASLRCDPTRLGVYAAATRCRLTCLYLFRPPYRSLALTWAAQP